MTKRFAFRGIILGMQRLKNSKNGNPRWIVSFFGGQLHKTASDESVGYTINNPNMKGIVEVEVYLNAASEIVDIRPVK